MFFKYIIKYIFFIHFIIGIFQGEAKTYLYIKIFIHPKTFFNSYAEILPDPSESNILKA